MQLGEKLGEGAYGTVYALSDDRVIKVFKKLVTMEEIITERDVARKVYDLGIPTANAYDIIEMEDGSYGLEFDRIRGRKLSEVMLEHPERFDEYISMTAETLRHLHSIDGTKAGFPGIKQTYTDFLKGSADWYTAGELSALLALVDSIPDRNTLIHGDYDPCNLMLQDDKLYVIDMDSMCTGHPAFELLSTSANLYILSDYNPDFLMYRTGMTPEFAKNTWNGILRNYFAGSSEDEIGRINGQILALARLKSATAPVFGKNLPREIIQSSVDTAKEYLLPLIDKLIGSIDW
ncbi:MAG: phosphotransferase [Eubacteriales bacterium]|nr:phosphotransferase [Eubacteriales bacterium]